MKPPSTGRQRILREAIRLFAERGYDRTSVPEIQEAAGLSRGSGALYKHFSSKEDLLATAIEQFVGTAREGRAELGGTTLSVDEGSRRLVESMLEKLGANRDVLRILWRDLEHFPELKAAARGEIMQSTYLAVAEWLRERQRQGELRPHDSEAVAAVIVGSVAMFRVFEAIWGERAIDVSDERFASAWSDLLLRGLRP
ncbi:MULTISPECIES: TetR/AcrR family transcriptional regulator [Mesorhizobium]|uniref:Transcriptional regulator, TetR family n=1 Tax=Mesorhizobium opportunistum (strain LMG 24607 / HAMBI 3007 / WSM2075) TaxID=536019 RepID=F7Y661_MESOW|nr:MULTISPECIES: TetR/AcrR family transcriptional regulator [Mesorhizobium]AEH89686.1 transcriptional regulator, TetR family [Mesorhizobium opportunistum WSM2075]MCA0032000.1 TetR/AcrR family transcriptional regulator [Mesorhizobium sp. B263B2A]TPN44032.1 TetR/AcrR family transcriptional regulator [Mesorhizobium sp. B1-1-7]